MTLYIAIAYYSDGGTPLVKFANSDKEIVKFMNANNYMTISVFKITPTGVELLDGQDLRVTK